MRACSGFSVSSVLSVVIIYIELRNNVSKLPKSCKNGVLNPEKLQNQGKKRILLRNYNHREHREREITFHNESLFGFLCVLSNSALCTNTRWRWLGRIRGRG